MDAHKLPDVLAEGLRVVFCGTAAGAYSARVGAYYANPANKFWRTLYAVGLTPRLLDPREFRLLPQYGVGLTDLAKSASGIDRDLKPDDHDPEGLRKKIGEYKPRVLAFNGKEAARVFYDLRSTKLVTCGRQPQPIGATAAFVLPSTSGSGSGYWDERYWHELADFLKT